VHPNIGWDQLSVPAPSKTGASARSLVVWGHWLRNTYRAGDVVELNKDARLSLRRIAGKWPPLYPRDPTQKASEYVMRGAKFEVVGEPYFSGTTFLMMVRLLDARDASGMPLSVVGWYADVPVKRMDPMVDNWAHAARPLGRHHLPSSQRSRMKPNISLDKLAVPMPSVSGGSLASATRSILKRDQWLKTTFAPGTPVKSVSNRFVGHKALWGVPVGARGEVVAVDREAVVKVRIVDARDEVGYQLPDWVGVEVESSHPEIEMEPLVDNWAEARPRRTSRHALPHAQRSWMKPNVAPDVMAVPPPGSQHSMRQWDWWLSKTFAPGTPVKAVRGARVKDDYGRLITHLPREARGVIVGAPKWTGSEWQVPIQIVDSRFVSGQRQYEIIGKGGWVEVEPEGGRWFGLEPLVDNWATAAPGPTSRHLLPHAQRSRMKPNPSRWGAPRRNPEGLDFGVGDTLELERHPVYDHPGDTPAYKVTRRKVKAITERESGAVIVRLVGMRQRLGKGHYIDKSFRLTGSGERGWWLSSGKPGPARYQILDVIRRR